MRMSLLYCMKCRKELHKEYERTFSRHVCRNCGEIYYDNPRPCVTALIVEQKRVLLNKRIMQPGAGSWDLVGGFIEKHEHPDHALKREMDEEIGVVPSDFQFFKIYMDVYGETDISTLNIVYICTIPHSFKIMTDEFSELQWFSVNELPGIYSFKSVEDILTDYTKYLERDIKLL